MNVRIFELFCFSIINVLTKHQKQIDFTLFGNGSYSSQIFTLRTRWFHHMRRDPWARSTSFSLHWEPPWQDTQSHQSPAHSPALAGIQLHSKSIPTLSACTCLPACGECPSNCYDKMIGSPGCGVEWQQYTEGALRMLPWIWLHSRPGIGIRVESVFRYIRKCKSASWCQQIKEIVIATKKATISTLQDRASVLRTNLRPRTIRTQSVFIHNFCWINQMSIKDPV